MQYEWLALALYILGIPMAAEIAALEYHRRFWMPLIIGLTWPVLMPFAIVMYVWERIFKP